MSDYELYETNPYINKNSYKCPTCATQVYGYTVQEIEDTSADTDSNSEISEL